MRKIRQLVFMEILLATIICVHANAQQKPVRYEFTAMQCAEFGAKNNLQVKNALLDLQIQQQTNRGITAGALPSLSGSGNVTDYLQIPTTLLPGQFFGQPAGTYIPVKFGTKYIASGTFNLQQALFDGQVFVGLQARKTSIDFRQKSIEVTEETIRANIYKIYYQLVISKTQMQLIDDNIAKAEKLLHDTRELYHNGFSEKVDVDRSSVQLANLQTSKSSTQNNIDNGYLSLKFLMGMPIKDTLLLTEQITEDEIKKGLLNEGIYQYMERKDYQLLGLEEKLNQYNIKRYKFSYLPTLNLTGSYSKQAQRTAFDFFGPGDWFTTAYLGLNLNVPIFDGFQKDANIKVARLQLKQTQNQIEDLRISIDNDVLQATNNYHNAIATLDFQKQNMNLAQQVYDQSKKKYEVGTGSNTDITNAEADMRTAQANYISAMYDAVIAKIDYLKAIGKLQ